MSQAESTPPQSIDSIKQISQAVIEEKECIIEQIYKQLRDSLHTTNYLTQQLENFKASTQDIDIAQLRSQGFLRQDDTRSLLVLDLSKVIHLGRQRIIVDASVEVVHEEVENQFRQRLASIQVGYKGALEKVELLLKALQEKQQKQEEVARQLQQKDQRIEELTRIVQEGKQREAVLIASKQQQETHQQMLAKQLAQKQISLAGQQEAYHQQEQQCRSLLEALAHKEQLIEGLQTHPPPSEPVQTQERASDKQLHEEIEMLELQLDQEKRERALEKAEWKGEIHKLKEELEQRKADDEIEQQNLAQLQNDNEGLRREIADLKGMVIRLQKKRESQYSNLPQLASPLAENRVTNDCVIKQHVDQFAIQSPHQFLPYQINSVQHFQMDTQPVPSAVQEVEPETQLQSQNTIGAPPPDQHALEEAINRQSSPRLRKGNQPQAVQRQELQNERQQLFQEKKQQILTGYEPVPDQRQQKLDQRDFKQAKSPIRDQKQGTLEAQLDIKKKQQIEQTNKSFPEARTDQKDEKQIEPEGIQIKAPEKNEKGKGETLESAPQAQLKRKHGHPDLGLKPIKPDKPGKHRKVIRINY